MKWVTCVLSRGLFGLFFILNGALQLLNWQETVHELTCAFSKCALSLKEIFPYWGICDSLLSNVSIVLGVALFLEVGGAFLILTGMRVRMGAFFLLLFLVPLTLGLPFFWWDNAGESHQRLLDFFKNLSFIGALLHFSIRSQPPPILK